LIKLWAIEIPVSLKLVVGGPIHGNDFTKMNTRKLFGPLKGIKFLFRRKEIALGGLSMSHRPQKRLNSAVLSLLALFRARLQADKRHGGEYLHQLPF
jgi:hypothetical protein